VTDNYVRKDFVFVFLDSRRAWRKMTKDPLTGFSLSPLAHLHLSRERDKASLGTS
jgi:hypothetical protein